MKPYFTTAHWIETLSGLPPACTILSASSLALLAGLDQKSGKQAIWRMTRQGLLTHLGGGFYTHAFAKASLDELAAVLVLPSYVTAESALRRAGVTTQPSSILTCATLEPTQTRVTPLGAIHYHSIARRFYWGFDIVKSANGLYTFLAWPEKALLDLVYLSRRRGEPVWIDLDFHRLDDARLRECAARFPATVAREVEELRHSHATVS